MIRQPIICVMGHVDHGKTSLLDRIRNTTIAAREAGGITQHIGASEVPIEVINKICGTSLKESNSKIVVPGLLFIDTPGHEAFTNLRKRGGSVADLAILVVDVTKGFEPQTVEAIEILKEYKTPFVVAANKIDVLTGWRNSKLSSVMESLKQQPPYVAEELDNRMFQFMGKLSEMGFSSERFDRVKDFQKEIAIIPLSAKTGEGISELLMLVTGLSQKYMEKKLNIEVSGPGRGSILEKNEVRGLGTTIDVILYDGSLHTNDTIAFATAEAIVTAKIKALLKPKPLHEIRESAGKFSYVDSVDAASGVKISGNGLEGAMPGSPIVQVTNDRYAEEIKSEIGEVFKTDRTGLILKADSIGSLEAMSRLLKAEGFSISKKSLGSVTKRDVLDAFTMLASDPTAAVILAFNVSIEPDALDTATSSKIKVIEEKVIYKLIDDYKEFVNQANRGAKEQLEKDVVFPGAIELLPNLCFHASHPAIFGINVVGGRVKPGYVLMNDEGTIVGKVKELQNEGKPVEMAKKGDSVAISVEGPTYGRQIREGQILYTRVKDSDESLLKGKLKEGLSQEEQDLLNRIISIKGSSKKTQQ